MNVDQDHCEVAQSRDSHLITQVVHHKDSQKYADEYLLPFHEEELPPKEVNKAAADEAGYSLAKGEPEHELLCQLHIATSHLSEQLLSVVKDSIDATELARSHHNHA